MEEGAVSDIDPGVELAFRRLTDADLSMLHHWLNEPGVVQWWEGDDVSWEGVVSDYGSGNIDHTEHWVASIDGRDIGWIQCYRVADSPEELAKWHPFGVRGTAAGIDYLIGDPANRGRGFGSAMIRSFIAEVVFGLHPEWDQVCAAPNAANAASWRALEKAGFLLLGIVEDSDGPCRLMVCNREPSLLASGGVGLHGKDRSGIAKGTEKARLHDETAVDAAAFPPGEASRPRSAGED